MLLLASGGSSCAIAGCSLLYAPDDSVTAGDKTNAEGGAQVDGNGNGDAVANGDAKSDTGGGSFCQRAPLDVKLCDDFERETLLGPWSARRIEGDSGATLAIERDDAGDGGRFLRATIRAQTAVSRAYLRRLELSAVTKRARFAYRIRLNGLAAPSTQSMVMGFGSSSVVRNVVGVTLTDGAPQVFEQSFNASGVSSGYKGTPLQSFAFSVGVFHSVQMLVQVDTKPAKITLMVDGNLVFTKDVALPFVPPEFSAYEAGLTYALPAPDVAIDIDDVIAQAE